MLRVVCSGVFVRRLSSVACRLLSLFIVCPIEVLFVAWWVVCRFVFCVLFVVVRLWFVVRRPVFGGWPSVFGLLLYRCYLLFVASVHGALFVICVGLLVLRCLSSFVCYLLFKDSRVWFSV